MPHHVDLARKKGLRSDVPPLGLHRRGRPLFSEPWPDLLLSIQFLGMIIIGGLGSISGTLMGTAFMVLLPEAMSASVGLLQRTEWGNVPAITQGLAFLKQAAIGLAIALFLIF